MAGLPLIFSGLLLFLLPWAQRTGRAVNVLKGLSVMDTQPRDEGQAEYVAAVLGMDSPIGSIQDFIRKEALVNEISSSQIPPQDKDRASRKEWKAKPKRFVRSMSDSALRYQLVQMQKPIHTELATSMSLPIQTTDNFQKTSLSSANLYNVDLSVSGLQQIKMQDTKLQDGVRKRSI